VKSEYKLGGDAGMKSLECDLVLRAVINILFFLSFINEASLKNRNDICEKS
jgi:hypothetical protein